MFIDEVEETVEQTGEGSSGRESWVNNGTRTRRSRNSRSQRRGSLT